MPAALSSESDRSLRRSRLRARVLLMLASVGEAHLGQLSRLVAAPPARVLAALVGRHPQYRADLSLVGLGLAFEERRPVGRVFVVSPRGRRKARSVARWLAGARRVERALLAGEVGASRARAVPPLAASPASSTASWSASWPSSWETVLGAGDVAGGMRVHSLVCLSLMLVPLSGCVGALDRVRDALEADPDPVKDFRIGFSASGCEEGVMFVLVDPDAVSQYLPPGFAPRDAQHLVDAPAPMGRAAVFLNAQRCESSTLGVSPMLEALVAVFVEPPNVTGAPRDPAYDFLELHRVSPHSAVRDHLGLVNWSASNGSVELEITPAPSGSARAVGTVADAEGELVSFDILAPNPGSLSGVGRFWRVTPGGLALVDHAFSSPTAAGSGTCSIREGSVAADVTGITSCGPGDGLGIVLLSSDFDAEFRFLPIVNGTAGSG